MPTLSTDEVSNIANTIKATGLQVGNYGGGSGETYHYNQTGLMQGGSISSKNIPDQGGLATKIGNIGKTIGRITVAGAKAAGKFVVNDIAKPIARTVEYDIANPAKELYTGFQETKLQDKANNLDSQYKAGKISKQDYTTQLADLHTSYNQFEKGRNSWNPYIDANGNPDVGKFVGDQLNVATDALSLGGSQIVKAAFGKATADLVPKFIESSAQSGEQLAKLVGANGSQVFKAAGGREVLNTLLDGSTNKLQQTLLKSGALRNVVLNNMTGLLKRDVQQQLVGETTAQFLQRNARDIAVGLLIKKPLFYQSNIDSAQEIYKDMSSGKYGQAAIISGLMGLQAVEGGPIGAIASWGKKATSKLHDLSYGTGSFIDEVGKLTDNKIAEDLLRKKAENPEAYNQSEKLWRIFQEMNLQMAGGDAKQAAINFLQNHIYAGEDLTKLTIDGLEKEAQNHYDAQQLVKGLFGRNIKGVDQSKIKNLVVARWDSVAKRQVAKAFLEAGNNLDARAAALQQLNDANGGSWKNNATLMKQLIDIASNSTTAEEAANKVMSIPTGAGIPSWVPKSVAKKLSDLGYVPIEPANGVRQTNYVDYEDTRKLISAVSKGSEEAAQVFDPDTAPQPILSSFAGALTKIGLSPQAAQKQAYQALSKSVANNLDSTGLASELGFDLHGDIMSGGQVILSKLQNKVDDIQAASVAKNIPLFGKNVRPAITDIRQLSTSEIKDALGGITNAQARAVKRAVTKGYTDVSLEMRGLGDKIVDYTYRINPLQGAYSRLQAALRYSYNPFFQTQESFETKAFSGLSGGNAITYKASHPEIWGKAGKELDATVSQLDNAGIFSSSLAGEAAQDQVLGRITADITQGQKRDLAGLALDIANRQGRTVQDVLDNNPEQIADALRVIVQYPQKGWLASPMARTLNLAFFPMRYNMKVLGLSAQILAKQPPSVQFATLHSILNLQDYMNSDEGIRWRQQNSDALQVFNWLSPLSNIEGVFNALGYAKDKVTGQPDNGISSLGQLGGLPFGLISQVLDSMGIISLNSPYVDPATGSVLPKYIPQTTKARAATALEDLIGNVFTYPGRILGLPGKSSSIRNVVNAFANVPKSDFNVQDQTGNLTPMQQNLVRVLKGDTSNEAINALYISPAKGQYNGYTMPPSVLPFNLPQQVPVESRMAVRASKKATARSKVKARAKPVGTF